MRILHYIGSGLVYESVLRVLERKNIRVNDHLVFVKQLQRSTLLHAVTSKELVSLLSQILRQMHAKERETVGRRSKKEKTGRQEKRRER